MANSMQKYNEKGKLTCDKNILLSIVNLATKEIKGVASLSNSNLPWYKKIVRNYCYDGVSIKFSLNGALRVDVYVNVYMGESTPDIAFRIQENIKNSLMSMVDIKATKINIHVMDVICDKEEF